MKIRLLSWNVHGLPAPITRHRALRLRRIAAQVDVHQPDVVALQEAWAGSLAIVAQALPAWTPFFHRTRAGGAAGGLLLLLPKRGNWTADASTLRFRRYSHYAPRHRVWEADGLAGKGALFLGLAHRSGHGHLWLVNTHLQSRYRANPYEQVRHAQLHELTRWVHEHGTTTPMLLCGDFNTPAEGDPLHEHIAALGDDLTRAERDRRGGGATNFPLQAEAGWIDYVIARAAAGGGAGGDVRLIENTAADDPYSDHSGLLADVEF